MASAPAGSRIAARVLEHIFDRGANRVGIDQDDFVDQLAAQLKRIHAEKFDGHAIGEQTDVGKRTRRPFFSEADMACGVDRLDADNFDFRAQPFHICGDAGNQSAAADGHKYRVQWFVVLAQDLHADRALPGDHVGIVVGMDERRAVPARPARARGHTRRHTSHRAARLRPPSFFTASTLMCGVVTGMTMVGIAIERARGQRHTLRMVARRGRDHATLARRRAKVEPSCCRRRAV